MSSVLSVLQIYTQIHCDSQWPFLVTADFSPLDFKPLLPHAVLLWDNGFIL